MSISCNLLTTILKLKNRMVVWAQNGFKSISCLSSWPRGWVGASIKRVLYRILLAQVMIKIQGKVSTEYILLLHHYKSKNLSWTTINLGPPILSNVAKSNKGQKTNLWICQLGSHLFSRMAEEEQQAMSSEEMGYKGNKVWTVFRRNLNRKENNDKIG